MLLQQPSRPVWAQVRFEHDEAHKSDEACGEYDDEKDEDVHMWQRKAKRLVSRAEQLSYRHRLKSEDSSKMAQPRAVTGAHPSKLVRSCEHTLRASHAKSVSFRVELACLQSSFEHDAEKRQDRTHREEQRCPRKGGGMLRAAGHDCDADHEKP
jgi:hypothetical protein